MKSRITDIECYIHNFNIYLREHHFPDYIIDTTSPGWLFGKHPQNHTRNDLIKQMTAEIKLACPVKAIPFFHISPCSPSRHEDSCRTFHTHALAIHISRNKLR
jgi:hypothetical protein